jgi:signal transduction histidine kinase
VDVDLVFAPDEVDLIVSDDGRGIVRPAAGERGGEGLRNMHERARRLGGRLTVTSEPGAGTKISLAVPLDSELPAPEPLGAPTTPEASTR